MQHGRKHHTAIYQSRLHVAITLAIVAFPFLFFALFSRLAHIALARLLGDVDASLARVLIAYLISAVLGWLSAVLFYRGRRALIVLPLFDVLQSFPAFSALPLAVIFWGRSNFTIIVFLVIAIIWPIFFSIISSLKLIRRDWEEAVEMSGLSGIRYLTHFLIPVSAPGLVTGSIIGLGEGWEALVATEIIVSPHRGLGEFFGAFAHDPVITGFGVLGVLLLIFSINKLIWLPLLERGHRMMEE